MDLHDGKFDVVNLLQPVIIFDMTFAMGEKTTNGSVHVYSHVYHVRGAFILDWVNSPRPLMLAVGRW